MSALLRIVYQFNSDAMHLYSLTVLTSTHNCHERQIIRLLQDANAEITEHRG
jgi:hypothetical protein